MADPPCPSRSAWSMPANAGTKIGAAPGARSAHAANGLPPWQLLTFRQSLTLASRSASMRVVEDVARRFVPQLTSTTVGLAVGITAAVAAATAAGAYFYSVQHSKTLIESARTTALSQGELIRAALEHQMIEDDRTLIARMINSFGQQPQVDNVMLLDRGGVVKYASKPGERDTTFSLSSPTCQACHQFAPAERATSRVIDTKDSAILRTVIPVHNRPACHECHDPDHRINGILILDTNTGAMRAGMNKDLRGLVIASAGLALLLIAGIAMVVRVAVLQRLRRFETTARMIAAGDLNKRVPEDGRDTISWLAREFNTMADATTGLVTQLNSQQKRLETVMNSMDDGIVVLDPDRKVLAANDAFLRRTGSTRNATVGCSCETLGEGVCTSADCPTLACFKTASRQVRLMERRMPDGTTRWEEVHASPMLGPTGAPSQVVEVWRDITERRAGEARMAESHRLASLGMLASGFSHEINTPLATTLTCVEGMLLDLAESGDIDRSQLAESATVAREQVLRCRAVTQQFLRLSRGQTAAADIVYLPDTVAAVVRLVEPTAREHGIRLATTIGGGDLHVRADDAELQHVLINLTLNAIQSSSSGSTVTLALEGGDAVHVRVIDHGCGIAVGDQQRIFEPFFSLRRGGTGLGLFLSRDFVRHWGGDIGVVSTLGGGSVFDVVLPPASAGSAARSA
ncbi:MAG: HAMP domain-containing protein [Acidobacteria bacterium]|nr:MAG: HAMP domain-containing protein [Acidobacteriota bacterium]